MLALLSRIPYIPSPIRFGMYASAMVCNAPGVVLLGQIFSYAFTRTLLGHLLGAALTTILAEPVLRWIERPKRRVPQPENSAQLVTRRALLLAGGGLTLGTTVGGYSYFIERKNFQFQPYRLYLPQLPPKLTGLRVALVADMHCGPVNRPQDLLPALQMIQKYKPDIILIPGDFVHLAEKYFSEAAELLATLRPTIPGAIFVSWGNHDHWNRVDRGARELVEAGCRPLIQKHLIVSPGRTLETSGPGLCIAGIDDLWEGNPELKLALKRVAPDQPRIVLCHNPDVAELQHGPRVDLMVSGHTHGGQVRIPLVGTPVLPSRYGQKYASGIVKGPHYPVYVTRGLGVGGIPVRLGVPPEVTFFELHPGPDRVRLNSVEYFS